MRLAVLVCLIVGAWALPFRKQKYATRVTLMCGDEPASDVRVRLMEHDTGAPVGHQFMELVGIEGPDPDDELDDGRTNNQGFIRLQGSERELGSIEPRLEIYHDCNDVNQKTGIPKPCQRKWRLDLPHSPYINGPDLDLGIINLEMKLKDEDRDCFN